MGRRVGVTIHTDGRLAPPYNQPEGAKIKTLVPRAKDLALNEELRN